MQVFEYKSSILEGWQVIILDSLTLASLSSLAIYFIVLKPVMDWQKKEDVSASRFGSMVITITLAYLSVITVLLMFLVLNYQLQFNSLKKDLITQEVNTLKLVKTAFLQQLNQVTSDVLSISHQVNVVEYLMQASAQREQELNKDFQTQVIFKPVYDQLRLLSIGGQELIKIHHNDKGLPVAVDRALLQDKSERYYFKEILSLNTDQVYISRIDLNEEQGKIELPYNPVLRVASAVRSSSEIAGAVVLNLKAQHLLDTLANLSFNNNTNRQLLDQNGYWLYGNSSEKQWGFMFPDKQHYSMSQENPEIWSILHQQEQGVFESAQNQVVYQAISIGEKYSQSVMLSTLENPRWFLVSFIPNQVITNQLEGTRTMMGYAFFFMSLLLGLAAYLLLLAMRQKKLAESKILQMLYSDSLTGLKNRKYFQWKLVREIFTAKKQNTKLAILYIDLNKFKAINDEMGHEVGDLVLKKVASVLLLCLRDDDTVARMGGDEFSAILPNVVSNQYLEDISRRIISLITEGLDIGGMNFYLDINIGIATMNNYDEPIRSFIARADQAMYESKSNDSVNFIFADKYRTI